MSGDEAPLRPGSSGELLSGDVAVVTGAGRGNGAAIARALARHGAAVAIVDRAGEAADEVAASIRASGGRASAFAVDLTDHEAVSKLPSEVESLLGPASILVNNAGILERVGSDAPDYIDSMRRQFEINVFAAAHMIHVFLDQLSGTAGRVINVGSVGAKRAPVAGSAYSASKAAIGQLTAVLAAELGERGVRVNAIAPGVIHTEMSRTIYEDTATADRFLSRIPLGFFGDPKDLTEPVVFLASQQSRYITGVTLAVDGGYLTR